MRLVLISDTHEQNLHTKWSIPDGDVLVHCGDISAMGEPHKMEQQARSMARLPHKYKLLVPGNHDRLFWQEPGMAKYIFGCRGIQVLVDQLVHVPDGHGGTLAIYGTPTIECKPVDFMRLNPDFLGFSVLDAREAYSWIPEGLDVLVTHCPPYGILDGPGHLGATSLANRLSLGLKQPPRIHAFGHVPHAYGTSTNGSTTFYNVALVDDDHRPAHEPVVVDMEAVSYAQGAAEGSGYL